MGNNLNDNNRSGMRKSKFRGLTDGGRWVYGCLVYSKDIQPAIYFEVGNVAKSFDWVYVKPETVGQFTGLLDKNGKEIYENNYINSNELKGVIIFELGSFFFEEIKPYRDYEPYKIDLYTLYTEDPNDIEVTDNKLPTPTA